VNHLNENNKFVKLEFTQAKNLVINLNHFISMHSTKKKSWNFFFQNHT